MSEDGDDSSRLFRIDWSHGFYDSKVSLGGSRPFKGLYGTQQKFRKSIGPPKGNIREYIYIYTYIYMYIYIYIL